MRKRTDAYRRKTAFARTDSRRGLYIGLPAAAVALILFLFVGGSVRALAGSGEQPLHKYYTSICLQKGDCLWSLAEAYAPAGVSHEAYIDEICSINRISEQDTLHSGQYLVVCYYASEPHTAD